MTPAAQKSVLPRPRKIFVPRNRAARYNLGVKYPTIFDLIEEEFGKAGILYVLVGGFAVNFYKVTRHTADVDFMIDEEDYEKAALILKNAGYSEFHHESLFGRFGGSPHYSIVVDLLLVNRETLLGISKEGSNVKFLGRTVTIPSLHHLIALKLHALKNNLEKREEKDMPDILGLIRTNKMDVNTPEFKQLCLTYGTLSLYAKIIKAITGGKK